MSHLLARIMLAVFMLPCAGVLYTLTYIVGYTIRVDYFSYPARRYAGWIFAGAVCLSFVMAYWILLWRKSVTWSPSRIRLTLLATAGAMMAGVVAAAALWWIGDDVGLFAATVVCPLAWLILTTFAWRETTAERVARSTGMAALTCPTCGYNLTGLKGTRCPECGSQFTLDELLARRETPAQPDLG